MLRHSVIVGLALGLVGCGSQAAPSSSTTIVVGSAAATTTVPVVAGPVAVSDLPVEGGSLRGVALRASIGGVERTWSVVAHRVNPEPQVPLVVVLHGAGETGWDMRSLGFEAVTADTGAVIAYPDGVDRSWNDERANVDARSHREHIDDVSFMRYLVTDARQRFPIDARRVFFVGFSNGGIFATYLACKDPTLAKAFALVAASAPANIGSTCTPTAAAPALMIQGTADPVVPFGGGNVMPIGGHTRGAVLGFENTFAWLRLWAGCAATRETLLATPPGVTRFEGAQCRADASPIAYRVDGAGHDWVTRPGFSATAVTWSFFRATGGP